MSACSPDGHLSLRCATTCLLTKPHQLCWWLLMQGILAYSMGRLSARPLFIHAGAPALSPKLFVHDLHSHQLDGYLFFYVSTCWYGGGVNYADLSTSVDTPAQPLSCSRFAAHRSLWCQEKLSARLHLLSVFSANHTTYLGFSSLGDPGMRLAVSESPGSRYEDHKRDAGTLTIGTHTDWGDKRCVSISSCCPCQAAPVKVKNST